MKAKKLVAIMLAMLLMTAATIAGTEGTDRETQINQFIDSLKNTREGKLQWEPEVLNIDNPVYANATPGEDDLAQEKALYIAIDTILTLTDKTLEDLEVYDVWFSFQRETTERGRSFWGVYFQWPLDVLGATYNYYVSVSSPDAQVIEFEIPPLT